MFENGIIWKKKIADEGTKKSNENRVQRRMVVTRY